MKSKILFALVIIAAAICMIFVILSSKGLENNKAVNLRQGSSTLEIADTLKENDVIPSRLMFLVKLAFSDYRGKLQYGTFEFSPGDSYDEIIKKLATDGEKKKTVRITVAEGCSVEKIIQLLCENGFGSKKEIKKALKADYDYEFLRAVNPPAECKYRLQGFLFPSTYEFYTDASPYDIIDRMLSEFEKQYKTLTSSYDNLYEIVTKASIIEREAKVDADRAKIAGVIENRLAADMKLQIDATVVYAVSDGLYDVTRVLYKDLEVNSPYNTYKYKGLPIGPISNPGLKALKAALYPEKHNYLYYVVDPDKNDGSHIFSEDFAKHVDAKK